MCECICVVQEAGGYKFDLDNSSCACLYSLPRFVTSTPHSPHLLLPTQHEPQAPSTLTQQSPSPLPTSELLLPVCSLAGGLWIPWRVNFTPLTKQQQLSTALPSASLTSSRSPYTQAENNVHSVPDSNISRKARSRQPFPRTGSSAPIDSRIRISSILASSFPMDAFESNPSL